MKTKHYSTKNCFQILSFVLLSSLVFGLSLFTQPPQCYAAQITLSWAANTESDVAGYKVFYGTSPGDYETTIDVGDTTTYVLEEAPEETTYFAVKAYNTSDLESDFSDEVTYTPEISTTTTTQLVTTTTTTQPVTTTTTTQPEITTTTTAQPEITTTTTATQETPASGGGGGGGGGGGAATGTDNPTSATSGCATDDDCGNGLFCNAGTGMCVECVNDSQCNDGVYCNGTERCSNNACLPGSNPCEDENLCDEENKTCVTESNPAECATDEDCSDGVFCNGVEKCSDGQCVAGDTPCGDNQHCDEQQAACFDTINVTTADLVNKPRKPVFMEKVHRWLVIFYAGDININESVTTVTIEGDDSDFHGIERDTTQPCYQLFNYIFVPVYIYRNATPGTWTIVIQAKEKDGITPSLQRMETSFQIQ